MNEIANNILTAIDVIVDKKIADMTFDRTVVVTVQQCVDSLIGKYRVYYQGESFTALAITGMSFNPGDKVRMLVPDNDLSQDKYLLGLIDASKHSITPASISDNYIKISENIVAEHEEQEFDFKNAVLYDALAQTTNAPLRIDFEEFDRTIKGANALIASVDVKTQFPLVDKNGQDMRYSGNYGLKFSFEYNNGSHKDFLFDSANFTGSIYNLNSYTSQIFAFNDIHGEDIKRLSAIEFYADGFNGLSKASGNAFSVKDIALYAAVSQNSLSQEVVAQGRAIKAADVQLNALGEVVAEQATVLEQTSSAIALKADKTTVDELTQQVVKAEAKLEVQADKIESTVSTINQELQHQATAITQKADTIQLTAVATEVDKQGQEVAKHASELAVMPATILATVSDGVSDESFGWQLQKDNFSLQSSGTEVLRTDKNGMRLKVADGHAGISNGKTRKSLLQDGESPVAFYCGDDSELLVVQQEIYATYEYEDDIICYITEGMGSAFEFTLPEQYSADDNVVFKLEKVIIIDGNHRAEYDIEQNTNWINIDSVSCTLIPNSQGRYIAEAQFTLDPNAEELSYYDNDFGLRVQVAVYVTASTYEVLADGSVYARGMQITGSQFAIHNTSQDSLGASWNSSFTWGSKKGSVPFQIDIDGPGESAAGFYAWQGVESSASVMYPTANIYASQPAASRETILQVEPEGVQIARLDYSKGGNLNVYGNITASNFPQTTSDARLKNTVEPLTSKYDILCDELVPVTFKYNDGTSNRLHVGFIAQGVKAAMDQAGLSTQEFGGLCIEHPDQENEIWRLRYEEFIALNTYKIQQLNARIKALENALDQLLSGGTQVPNAQNEGGY